MSCICSLALCKWCSQGQNKHNKCIVVGFVLHFTFFILSLHLGVRLLAIVNTANFKFMLLLSLY